VSLTYQQTRAGVTLRRENEWPGRVGFDPLRLEVVTIASPPRACYVVRIAAQLGWAAKVAVNRLAFSEGHELKPYEVTAVAITQGWLRSEMMLDNFGVAEPNRRDALDPEGTQPMPRWRPVARSEGCGEVLNLCGSLLPRASITTGCSQSSD
jgi:NAD(P)-dependent dehydrogenase (short-subunit alcohol dehydrogenase family)